MNLHWLIFKYYINFAFLDDPHLVVTYNLFNILLDLIYLSIIKNSHVMGHLAGSVDTSCTLDLRAVSSSLTLGVEPT